MNLTLLQLNNKTGLHYVQHLRTSFILPTTINIPSVVNGIRKSEGVSNFERKVLKNIQAKTVKNRVLTGKMLMGLTIEYLQAINSGGIPTILSSLESVISSQIRNIFEEARGDYLKQMNLIFSIDNLPLEEDTFLIQHKNIITNLFSSLQQKSKNFIDAEQLTILRSDLQEIIESEGKMKSTLNQQISSNTSVKAFLHAMTKLSLPQFTHSNDITQNFILNKYEDTQDILQKYISETTGNSKYTVFFHKYPSRIFEYFNTIFTLTHNLFQEEISKIQVKLHHSTESLDICKNNILLYEKLTLDLQREGAANQTVIDSLKREQIWLKKNQENYDKTQFGKIEELEIIIHKKKNKLIKFKAESSDLQEKLHSVRIELNQKKIENQGLKKDIEELKSMRKSSSSSTQNRSIEEEEIPELLFSIRDIKNQIQYMDEFFTSKNLFNSATSTQDSQLQDFQQFRKDKETMKKTYKQKLESNKHLYEIDKEHLNKKIDMLNKYIDDIRAKNMELITSNEEFKKKTTSITNLIAENEKLREGLIAKQQNFETTTQVLNEFSKQIEKTSSIKLDLENQLAYIKSENCKLMSFKETFPYILRESLKYVLNRNSKLKHSLKQLNDEDIDQVRNCFAEVGIEIKF